MCAPLKLRLAQRLRRARATHARTDPRFVASILRAASRALVLTVPSELISSVSSPFPRGSFGYLTSATSCSRPSVPHLTVGLSGLSVFAEALAPGTSAAVRL